MTYYYEDHLDTVRQDLEGAERAMAGMEREMDKMIYEISDLKRQLAEAEIEISRLQGALGMVD